MFKLSFVSCSMFNHFVCLQTNVECSGTSESIEIYYKSSLFETLSVHI